MNRALKILAIVMLLVTVSGAGVVLYGLTMMKPQVEEVSVIATPAAQVPETFGAVLEQVKEGTFAGRQFTSAEGLQAQDCTFLTYTVRLKNGGFFPAEWIYLTVEPQQSADGTGYDILQLGDDHAYVLGAGNRGDLTATILRVGNTDDKTRQLLVSCYVFGQRIEVAVRAD